MTKKDYKAIANAIRNRSFEDDCGINCLSVSNVIELLTEVMKADNPAFDEAKFRAACQ